jgi:hypothetical protein
LGFVGRFGGHKADYDAVRRVCTLTAIGFEAQFGFRKSD